METNLKYYEALNLMCSAAEYYDRQIAPNWDYYEFNQWLNENWGVNYNYGNVKNIVSVLDQRKFLLFLIRFSA
jgi:hypothetical protein